MMVPPDLVRHAQVMADIAADMARAAFRQTQKETQKDDKTWVTETDHTIEMRLRDYLATHRPDDGIIGEEYGRSNGAATWQWIIDPIDGTRAFMLGRPSFGFLLALHHEANGFVLGLADQPIMRDRWLATLNGGMVFNGHAVTGAAQSDIAGMRLAVTMPWRLSADIRVAVEEKLITQTNLFHAGGDFLNFAGLADGSIHAVVESQQFLYDVAPFLCMVGETGGRLTQSDGTPITIDCLDPMVVVGACTAALHDKLVHALVV